MSEEIPLEEVKGIGPTTAEKLIDAGIKSANDLAIRRPEEIKDILKISLKAAKDIVTDAQAKALDKAVKLEPMKEIMKHKKEITKRISTSSLAIDNLLKGGVPTEAITVLFGEYASGKSQLCFQLAVNTIKAKRKVCWVETESGTFSPDRILEIAKASGVEINPDEDIFVISAKNIATPYNQFLAYQLIDKIATEKKWDIGLIVVDSFSSKFRSFYVGREQLPSRSAEESRHLGFLDVLASKYNCAVVLTVQIMDVPDEKLQLRQMVKTGLRKELTGGNVVKHSGTYLLGLQKVSKDEWELTVADAPDIPMESVRFRILSSGVRDIVTRK